MSQICHLIFLYWHIAYYRLDWTEDLKKLVVKLRDNIDDCISQDIYVTLTSKINKTTIIDPVVEFTQSHHKLKMRK